MKKKIERVENNINDAIRELGGEDELFTPLLYANAKRAMFLDEQWYPMFYSQQRFVTYHHLPNKLQEHRLFYRNYLLIVRNKIQQKSSVLHEILTTDISVCTIHVVVITKAYEDYI